MVLFKNETINTLQHLKNEILAIKGLIAAANKTISDSMSSHFNFFSNNLKILQIEKNTAINNSNDLLKFYQTLTQKRIPSLSQIENKLENLKTTKIISYINS